MLRQLTILACALLLLAGLWFFFKPQMPIDSGSADEISLNYYLSVNDGVVAGPAVLVGRQGYPLTITFLSDQSDRVHLHGYELWLALPAGEQVEWVVDAKYSGRYLLELEDQEIPLGSLEVYP